MNNGMLKSPKPLYTKPESNQLAPGPAASISEPKPFTNPYGAAETNPLAAIRKNALINAMPHMHLAPQMHQQAVAPVAPVKGIQAVAANSPGYNFHRLRSMMGAK